MTHLVHDDKSIQTIDIQWQTQARGTNDQEYGIYLSGVDNKGLWLDGSPVKTYNEWLNS